ncbi:AIG1 family protein [Entamoeba histolytica HM-3:IMSS]|uniref:AIG1 family protein n=1 Tax=Entamoeba histolytica HM-3:IMSS TaxID=885315 RepID=M7XA63_ENTHI|nr:AIG1 family protein [Entamoeba histolytica HM-3:IMSS]
MSTGDSKEAKMVLIGGIGDGKSSLGNFILKTTKFDVSNSSAPKTQETIGYNGEGDRKNVFVIDTPGVQDSSEMNENQLNQMVDYIKEQTGVQAIVIVLDFNKEVLSDNVKRLLKLICNVFPTEGFWEHVCVVWSKCLYSISENELERQIKIKKEKLLPELKKLIKDTTRDEEDIEFPMYFVDCVPVEGSNNSRSENEIKKLLTWGYYLTPINKKRNTKRIIKYKNIDIETKDITSVEEANNKEVKIKTEHKTREKRTGFDGEITYTEWKTESTDYKTESRPSSSWCVVV